jgi:hypothetical protein
LSYDSHAGVSTPDEIRIAVPRFATDKAVASECARDLEFVYGSGGSASTSSVTLTYAQLHELADRIKAEVPR